MNITSSDTSAFALAKVVRRMREATGSPSASTGRVDKILAEHDPLHGMAEATRGPPSPAPVAAWAGVAAHRPSGVWLLRAI